MTTVLTDEGIDTSGTDVWEALDDALDLGSLRPKLAEGVEVVRFETRWGNGYTMVKNPRGPDYFRFSAEDGEILDLLDGTHTVRELVVDRMRDSNAFEFDNVVDLVQLLYEGDFLTDRWVDAYALVGQRLDSAATQRAKRIRHFLRAQTVQIGPRMHDIVDVAYRWGGKYLFTIYAHVVLLTVLFGGAVLFYFDVHDKHFAISSKALATSFGLLFVLDLAATMIHEAGHALAIRHANRKVLAAGFQLYLGHPAFFIDAADIMMATPRQRVRQAWFGPYMGFVIAGLCGGLVWFFPHAGTAQTLFNLAVLTYVTAAMNLIPFLELDGYWILMDLFQTNALRQRSFAFLRHELPEKIRTRSGFTRFDWVLIGFGVIGAVFTVLALVTSYLFWKPVFGALVKKMWDGGLTGRILLVLITAFVLGPLVHWCIEMLRALERKMRFLARRLRFRAELSWRREAGEMISNLPMLSMIPLESLNELAGRVELRRVAAGAVVVRQGESASEFFVIRSGRVNVIDEVPGGEEEVLRSMGPGQAFGELALLQGTPRTATVRAEVDTELFTVDKGSFDRLLADSVTAPELAPSVSALMSVWSMPPFRHLSATEAHKVAEAGRWLAVMPDVDVVKAGDVGDAYYVVGSGHLTVVEDERVVRDLGPGDYFGEVALLLDVPRTATVRTRTPARLFALDRAAFNKVIASAFKSGALRVTAADRMIQERT
ncbi:MAG TPA: cyclic nucleotide-binding domain-containing protein [Mycobacteriales bacterium]|nr:cyclic nucleotide-binding domain-containing protein [Mycobacteriales bacterium]